MQKTNFIRVIDALSFIQKLLRDNHLYSQCEKQFDVIGDYVGDIAPDVVDDEGEPLRRKRRSKKSKIKELENEANKR